MQDESAIFIANSYRFLPLPTNNNLYLYSPCSKINYNHENIDNKSCLQNKSGIHRVSKVNFYLIEL